MGEYDSSMMVKGLDLTRATVRVSVLTCRVPLLVTVSRLNGVRVWRRRQQCKSPFDADVVCDLNRQEAVFDHAFDR